MRTVVALTRSEKSLYPQIHPAKPSGRHVRRYMTPAMGTVRAAGAVVVLAGAWFQVRWALPSGVAIVLFGRLRGLLVPG